MEAQGSHDWERLRELCRRLRAPGGCDWDRRQTIATLTPYVVEEAHEVAEACAAQDPARIVEELGDLLYLIIFAVTIAEEEGLFDFAAVAEMISAKLIARHPHVFAHPENGLDFAQARRQWESIKKREKLARGVAGDTLAPGARGLPALLQAFRVQEKAASFGFDWPDAQAVLEKLDEERRELADAMAADGRSAPRGAVHEELGDLLFTLVNLGRHLEADPEQLLLRATNKFRHRFARMEELLAEQGISPAAADLDTLERAWQQAKITLAATPETESSAGEDGTSRAP